MAGLWELWQLPPALLPPRSPARVLWGKLLASGPQGSSVGLNCWSGFGTAAFDGFTTALCSTQASRMHFLLPSLLQLLQAADCEVVGMSLCVLRKVLEAADMANARAIALQLAERLPPLFDNVRLCDPTTDAGC